jgi:hypothetical protein
MSTYDDASLIYYPSGYKEDKIYSLKPTDGSGDLTFTRASSATRVNAEGLIENAFVLGAELITNGDFATDSDWTKGSGWTISGGTANYDGVASIGDIQQSESLVLGKTYKYSFTISNRTQGGVRFFVGNTVGLTHSANGTFTGYITYSSGGYILLQARDSFIGSIDNVSVKEVITLNVPRIDYTGGGCGKLLLEPQRTNLQPLSRQISSYTYLNEVAVVDNSGTSPDGTTNASLITPNTNNAAHYVGRNITGITASTPYVHSFFAKANGYNKAVLYINNIYSAFAVAIIEYDLSLGTVSILSGSPTSTSIEDYGNGWYRCVSVNTSLAGASGTIRSYVYVNSSSNYSGDGTSGMYLWGYQLEAGSYSTSLINTSGTAVTRLADTASKSGISSLIGQTEGVLYCEVDVKSGYDTNNLMVTLSNGTNLKQIYINRSNGKLEFFVGTNINEMLYLTPSVLTNGVHKLALAYKQDDFAVAIDGVIAYTDNSGNVPTCNKINVGSHYNENLPFNDRVNDVKLYKTRLTNAELATLTTL